MSRSEANSALVKPYRFEALDIYAGLNNEVKIPGKIQKTIYDIIFLASLEGKGVTARKITCALQDKFPEKHVADELTIAGSIRELRRKLRAYGDNVRIGNVRGKGYILEINERKLGYF